MILSEAREILQRQRQESEASDLLKIVLEDNAVNCSSVRRSDNGFEVIYYDMPEGKKLPKTFLGLQVEYHQDLLTWGVRQGIFC